MLQRVEISAVLHGERQRHRVHWERDMELSLDCFICERQGRTTFLEWGAERARCTADEQHGRHFAAARITGFDSSVERERVSMRAVVEYWWAPFHDAKRGAEGRPLTASPWVRLNFSHICARSDHRIGRSTTQTNAVWPENSVCAHCGEVAARGLEAPTIRLIS